MLRETKILSPESLLDITPYTGYFHDGSILDIEHQEDNTIFSLESAEIDPFEIMNVEILSKSNTLFGKLHLKGIRIIQNSDEASKAVIHKIYDSGEILDLEIYPNRVFLLIQWWNFPPKPRDNDVTTIELEAEEIYWENMAWAGGYKSRILTED
jgi:hypothetical protein